MTRVGYTNLSPALIRTALFERLAAKRHLDPRLHADRVNIVTFALELADAVIATEQDAELWESRLRALRKEAVE